MPISRTQAVYRLLSLWNARCIEDPTYVFRVKLADVVTPGIIDIVIAGDMFGEFEPVENRLRAAIQDFYRDQNMLKAWF